jgi:hypothetical protein
VPRNCRNSENCKSEFQFSDSPEIGISKKNPTGIFGIVNKIGILPPMGVPEIRTKNRNSQPRNPKMLKTGLKYLFLYKIWFLKKVSDKQVRCILPHWKAEDLSFLYVLLVWGVELVSS